MELVPYPTHEQDILLDVGCGDGRYIISSIKNRGYFSIGIDPNNKVSLIPAKKRISEAGFNAFLIRSVGESTPLRESSVSVALCNSALDHMIEPNAVLKEIHRVLKENGTLIMWQGIYQHKNHKKETFEQETHVNVFSKESLFEMLKDTGFSINCINLLGCDIIASSEENKAISSRFPEFFNNQLSTLLQLYLSLGKIFPKHASIIMLKLKKT